MIGNTWNRIVEWFKDRNERSQLIREFNASARDAFVDGNVPTLIKASMSRGCREYKHSFSDWLYTGFRIQAFSGRALSKSEIISIGLVVMNDPRLVRKLIVLGWDTLEVHDDSGKYGCKWQLKDIMQISNL